MPETKEEKHWGQEGVTIEELSDEEREMYLKQAGPMGEMARTAWAAVQEREERDAQVAQASAGAVGQEQERALGEPPEDFAARAGTSAPAGVDATGASAAPGQPGSEDEGDEEDELEEEPGSQTDRERAEAKAAELGLEVRDYGTAGDWRLYDPKTGRQVAKSTVLP